LAGYSTSLGLVTEIINSSERHDPIVSELIEKAQKEIDRLTSLLKDYRSFARPHMLNFQPSNLQEVATEVLGPAINDYRTAGVNVTYDFPDHLPLAQVDREKIKQVILNLSKNAVQPMPDGGTLTCRGYEANGYVILEIIDTGTGIPDAVDVFQLFKTTKPYGTGLGLPIVQQIVSEHRELLSISLRKEQARCSACRFPYPHKDLRKGACLLRC
jgi:signal transduction histidine kinase